MTAEVIWRDGVPVTPQQAATEPTICGRTGRSIYAHPRCWDDCWGTCVTVAQQAVIDATGALPWPLTHEGRAALAALRAGAAPDAAGQVIGPPVLCAATGEQLPLTEACDPECFTRCGRTGGAR